MNPKYLPPISLIFLAVLGCGDPAKDLFETAQFEERQHNQTHARELYEQIVKQYPASDFAKKADARLADLGSAQKPVP